MDSATCDIRPSDLDPSREHQHAPGPSLWPVGFAVGVVVLLVGFVVSWAIVAIGAFITVFFAFLWLRELARKTRSRRSRRRSSPRSASRARRHRFRGPRRSTRPTSATRATSSSRPRPSGSAPSSAGSSPFPCSDSRSGRPSSSRASATPTSARSTTYPEGEYIVTTFTSSDEGDVSRRTAFIRNNGFLGDQPSFTILSNHCAHLGCPVQPNGAIQFKKITSYRDVRKLPVNPSGFGCPCHGGQYDTEGNRTAGPPVRALDRYSFSIVNGHLMVGKPFSVAYVDGTGAGARIHKATYSFPGEPVERPGVLALPDPASPLMAAKKTTQERILYPLDWLEERSGLVGAVRYFLFRNVPADINWFQTLGSATLTAFVVQAATGVILAMYYQPGPTTAYSSIQHITNDLWGGWLVRGMHKWGASVFIILMFLHMGRVFLFGAYKYPRELNWIIGVLLLALGLAEGFTGYLLPWDQTSYWATTVGINLNGTAPFLGPFIAQFLQGGTYINADTISRFYAIHMLLLPAAIGGLIALHLYLVIRLGVTSPPWSKEAAGTGPLPTPSTNGSGPRPQWPHRREGRRAWLTTGSSSASGSSSSTRRTSRSAGSRSSRSRCGTTRSCRSSSCW